MFPHRNETRIGGNTIFIDNKVGDADS